MGKRCVELEFKEDKGGIDHVFGDAAIRGSHGERSAPSM